MELVLWAGSNEMRDKYILAAENHNQKMSGNPYPDAGFDLFLPGDCVCKEGQPNRLNFQVKCSAKIICENGKTFATGFYMYPRSSLSKSMLRLANSVGIIDSGYRGDIMGMFDCSMPSYLVYKYAASDCQIFQSLGSKIGITHTPKPVSHLSSINSWLTHDQRHHLD